MYVHQLKILFTISHLKMALEILVNDPNLVFQFSYVATLVIIHKTNSQIWL